ncbi:MAG TPA: sigma-70 family RNA polymerase sigma factor [Gemmatirosa sp.]
MRELRHVPTAEQLLSYSWPLDALVAGARDGKDAHVGELARRFGDRLLARLYALSPTLAGEIVTDTFMALPDKLVHYDDRGKFEPWLMGVAVHLLRTRRRSEDRRRETTGSSELRNVPGSRIPGRTLEQQEIVEQLLGALPARQRQVWELLETGFTPAEVAAMLTLDVNNVYQLKNRARKTLRRAAREVLGL